MVLHHILLLILLQVIFECLQLHLYPFVGKKSLSCRSIHGKWTRCYFLFYPFEAQKIILLFWHHTQTQLSSLASLGLSICISFPQHLTTCPLPFSTFTRIDVHVVMMFGVRCVEHVFALFVNFPNNSGMCSDIDGGILLSPALYLAEICILDLTFA